MRLVESIKKFRGVIDICLALAFILPILLFSARPGMRADLNVIDYENPPVSAQKPGGARHCRADNKERLATLFTT